MEDKWFARTIEDAVAFGRLMQRVLPNPRPFVLARVELPVSYLALLHHEIRLDGVGPACLIRKDQLSEVNRDGWIVVNDVIYA